MNSAKIKLLKILSSLFLLFILVSCSTLKTTSQKNYIHLAWPERLSKLNKLKKWTIDGSFSIKHENKTEIATFIWQQKNDSYNINIKSPLNLLSFYIVGNASEVTLWKSVTEKYKSDSPEKLLARETKWHLPIANLIYWIKARPVPNETYKIKFDIFNHPRELKQGNWIINYNNFVMTNYTDLPTKIFLQNEQFKIKLVIRNWNLGLN